MNKLILFTMTTALLYSSGTLAEQDDYIKINIAQSCEQMSDYALRICIENNTGTVVTTDTIILNYNKSNDWDDEGGGFEYSNWNPNTYLIISVFPKFFTTPDQNSETYGRLDFFLSKSDEYEPLLHCQIGWLSITPPYKSPATLVFERNGNDYSCHFNS